MARYERPAGLVAGGSVIKTADRMDIFSIALPTTYNTANGIMVDLSATFPNAIREVIVCRGGWGGVNFEVVQEMTDTFAAGKFRVRAKTGMPSGTISSTSAGTPAGTNSTPTLTMNAYTPAGTNSTPTLTMNSHTHSVAVVIGTAGDAALAYTSTNFTGKGLSSGTISSGTNATTSTGSVSAPTFTGTQATLTGSVTAPTFTGSAMSGHTHTFTGSSSANQEVANSTNLQTLTGFTSITVLVIGS